jgi:DeoR family transcriptional regulator, fructose operon transcriptional repressor
VFGASSDDLLESAAKRAMAACARETLVLADRSKFGICARHRTLEPERIHRIATDAEPALTDAFAEFGTEVSRA